MNSKADKEKTAVDRTMSRRTQLMVVACLFATLAGGCATPLDQREDAYRTYAGALSACRQQQPGRASRKFHLPPTHPHVSECLNRHGWNSDGTRREKAR